MISVGVSFKTLKLVVELFLNSVLNGKKIDAVVPASVRKKILKPTLGTVMRKHILISLFEIFINRSLTGNTLGTDTFYMYVSKHLKSLAAPKLVLLCAHIPPIPIVLNAPTVVRTIFPPELGLFALPSSFGLLGLGE